MPRNDRFCRFSSFFRRISLLLVAFVSFQIGAAAQNAPVDVPPSATTYTPVLPWNNGPVPGWVSELTQKAENYFLLGTRAFDDGRYQAAREYFNLSIDTLFESSTGARAHPALNHYYLQLVERIRRYDSLMQQTEAGWGQQAFVPSPLDLLAEVEADPNDTTPIADGANDLDFDGEIMTPEVKSFLRFFNGAKGRPTILSGLRRAGRYFSLSRRIFAQERVPLDLIWLAQAESGWRNNALSTASAYGIWQFMPGTGARFGLAQNPWIDERAGIEQPTRAAARYLRWLYDRYGDWLLAMAAYNCGEGNVDRALARSRGKDFWSLHRQNLLPKETRNYVPIILAITLIAKHPDQYGFDGIKADPPMSYDTLPLTASVDLRNLSVQSGVSLAALKELNPELLQDVTPPGQYQLRVPRSASNLRTVLASMEVLPQKFKTRLARAKKK